MTKHKVKRLTNLEKFDIIALLKEHTKEIGEKLVEYEDGWSDRRIAALKNTDIGQIANLRNSTVGNLVVRTRKGPVEFEQLEARIASLEKIVSEFTSMVGRDIAALKSNLGAVAQTVSVELPSLKRTVSHLFDAVTDPNRPSPQGQSSQPQLPLNGKGHM